MAQTVRIDMKKRYEDIRIAVLKQKGRIVKHSSVVD